jgi:hypothetical protein
MHDSQRLVLERWEVSGSHIPYNFKRVLHNGYTQMCPVVYEARDVVLGHLGQLFLENALQTRQDDGAFPPPVIIHDPELNLAIALLDDSRLLWKGDYPFDWGRGRLVGLLRCRRAVLYALRGCAGGVGSRFALGFVGQIVSYAQAQGQVWRRARCSEGGYGER